MFPVKLRVSHLKQRNSRQVLQHQCCNNLKSSLRNPHRAMAALHPKCESDKSYRCHRIDSGNVMGFRPHCLPISAPHRLLWSCLKVSEYFQMFRKAYVTTENASWPKLPVSSAVVDGAKEQSLASPVAGSQYNFDSYVNVNF